MQGVDACMLGCARKFSASFKAHFVTHFFLDLKIMQIDTSLRAAIKWRGLKI